MHATGPRTHRARTTYDVRAPNRVAYVSVIVYTIVVSPSDDSFRMYNYLETCMHCTHNVIPTLLPWSTATYNQSLQI